jgi:hypothetical protein
MRPGGSTFWDIHMYIHKLLWYRGKHRVFLSGDYEFLSRAQEQVVRVKIV